MDNDIPTFEFPEALTQPAIGRIMDIVRSMIDAWMVNMVKTGASAEDIQMAAGGVRFGRDLLLALNTNIGYADHVEETQESRPRAVRRPQHAHAPRTQPGPPPIDIGS